MQVDEENFSVEVYHLDICGVNGLWLWDFGVMTLHGSESNPLGVTRNLELFSAVCNGLDSIQLSDKEPNRVDDLTVYLGDYVTYIPTSRDNATHLISEDSIVYEIVSEAERDGREYIVVQEVKTRQKTDKLLREKEEVVDWTPVIEY